MNTVGLVANPISPFDVDDVRSRVSTALEEFIVEQRPGLVEISPQVETLYDLAGAFTSGGKRLRSVLAWWGWRGAGGADDDASALRAVTSLELLQACALIHDDVMDGSDTRRGSPSIHRSLESLHAQRGWQGSAADFGVAGAILLGDLCLTWSDQLLFDSGLAPTDLLRAKPIFDVMRTELMAGQYLDVVEQAQGDTTAERALHVARYKSAKYTVERPLHLGVSLAADRPDLIAALSDFGLPLGEAFQLRDDVLGVFGDPEVTGKPAGDDIREGKRTFLVAAALESADANQAAVLQGALGNAQLSADGVERARAVIIDTKALARTEEQIDRLADQASEALRHADLANGATAVLADLATAATQRKK
jgi:geranylgeranyl diphosphate synthase type I